MYKGVKSIRIFREATYKEAIVGIYADHAGTAAEDGP